ncbi:adenosylcobyric acid synthase [uncultured Vagococcus sp.]|uniref:type 1 glutamine amidotransferase n=1 Tax=uncultured Vagococcus sp. TaxID=189676 RepID=UPI0028D42AD2|nr:adenosylcobyric acid synthase [uncultured Vagococcus sp.]
MSLEIRACHLYGNLLNTYGDNGNMLMMAYQAKQLGVTFTSEIISVYEEFDPDSYDFVFFGGGQDFEQLIVSKDLQTKKEPLTRYIEENGVMLAICGGYQMLGHYYMGAHGEKIPGISALDHYTLSQDNNRFIGDVEIYNEEFKEAYEGFENHNGKTYLGKGERPLGVVKEGYGNNGEDKTEGAIYKNTYCSYFHGPLLARNEHLAKRLIQLILVKKYGEDYLTK